ncbi:MAG TPA: chemotaxis protein CheW [Gammaproteobacteria bacterium]|nr:chemotaxis protein CheW [Gammaproteobacteria bacterium]
MKTAARHPQLLDQQLALSAYLDVMLCDVAAPVQQAEAPAVNEAPPADVAVSVPAPPATPAADGVPEWAATRFQALLFEVAGLTLAVPLVKLKGVVPNEGGLTPMPGHSPLFLGLLTYQGMQSRVVDTARFILPQDHAAQLGDAEAERSAQLVMIDEGRWALACNSIGEVIELERDDVKWRSANGKRPWLAGTVIEKMCALLDVDALAGELESGMA